jgi:hypothetical protein
LGNSDCESNEHAVRGGFTYYKEVLMDEIEESRIRLTEIQAILENNLYADVVEEADLMNERDYLEELLLKYE